MPPVRVRYQTIEFGEVDLHVRTLRDVQEFSDDQGEAERLGISSAVWPLFGVVWESGRALARLMATYEVGERRVLEVGCGIGLASLMLHHRDANITATDHHPEAGHFLRRNVALNGGSEIPFERTGWGDESDTLGTFDLIIGSDILYERGLVTVLADFLARHARPTCEVVLLDPGRGKSNAFGRAMAEHGFDYVRTTAHPGDDAEEVYNGHLIVCRRVRATEAAPGAEAGATPAELDPAATASDE